MCPFVPFCTLFVNTPAAHLAMAAGDRRLDGRFLVLALAADKESKSPARGGADNLRPQSVIGQLRGTAVNRKAP